MRSMGTIRTRQPTRLRLVEPLSSTDEFSTWSYDHFRDLFTMELRPHQHASFPNSWHLITNAQIYCQFMYNGTRQIDGNAPSFIPDRPRTGSLEQFVTDVFAKEDMQAEKWLKALHDEDILTYAHLSNIKHAEWTNIKSIPMHPKKILQTAVDRERESADNDRRRLSEGNTPDAESTGNTFHARESIPNRSLILENSSKESRSELLADLHLIKLFIHYTLRFERALENYVIPAKLEAKCINASFSEMEQEGYADDGLFTTMADFFLPLTISEEELQRTRTTPTRQVRQAQHGDLVERVKHLDILLAEAIQYRWDVDEKMTDLHKTKEQVFIAHSNERSQIDPTLSIRAQAEKLQELDRQWQQNRKELDQQLVELKREEDKWLGEIAGYEKEIDELKRQIQNIETELSQPQRPMDKGLVKPARGFIMYGPPGTIFSFSKFSIEEKKPMIVFRYWQIGDHE